MRKIASACLLAAALSQAFAQPVPAARGPLTLGDALQRARGYEARYQADEASFRSDAEILPQTRGLLLPEVSASASRTSNSLDALQGGRFAGSLDYYSGGWAVQLRQPIYRPENFARYQQAKAEVSRLEAVLSSDRNRLAVDLSATYLETLRSLAEFRAYEAQQRSLAGQAAAATRGVPLGLVSASERDERKARAEIAQLRLMQARGKFVEALRTLEKMVGVTVTELLGPDQARMEAANLTVEDLPVWLERAQNNAPEIRAARAAVEVAREGVERAKAGHKPTVDFVAARSKSTSESFTSINQTFYNSSLGVQLNVPIYAGGRVESGVRQAVAQQEKAQAQLDQALRDTSVLVEREHMTVRQAEQRLRAYQAYIASAQQNLAAAKAGVERGTRSQLDVLDAQGQLEGALNERSGALAELLAARMRLQSLAGEVGDTDVAMLDRLLTQPVKLPDVR